MSLFSNVDASGMQEVKDFTGGLPFTTEKVVFQIEACWVAQSPRGSWFVHLDLLECGGNQRKHSENIYITNSNGQAYYVRNDSKVPLPGYAVMSGLTGLLLGSNDVMSALESKGGIVPGMTAENYGKKIIVNSVGNVIGKTINTVIMLKTETETAPHVTESGKKLYLPTGGSREVNSIEKFLTEKNQTYPEVAASGPEGEATWFKGFESKLGTVVKGRIKERDARLDAGNATQGAMVSSILDPSAATPPAGNVPMFGAATVAPTE